MAFWNRYPYTNFHELNLDWIIAELKSLKSKVDTILSGATTDTETQTALNKKARATIHALERYYLAPNTAVISSLFDAFIKFNRATGLFEFWGGFKNTDAIPAGTILYRANPARALPRPNTNIKMVAAVLRNVPSNATVYVQLQYNTDGTITNVGAIGANAEVRIHYADVIYWRGDFAPYQIVTSDQIAAATATYKSWQNRFAYGNNLAQRLNPETSGYTDCSGSIAAACIANGFMLPDFANAFAGLGKYVTHAKEYEPLDLSAIRKGDVICYSYDGGNTYDHVAWCVDDNEFWSMDHNYDSTTSTNGPQPVANMQTWRNSQYRMVVRFTELP